MDAELIFLDSIKYKGMQVIEEDEYRDRIGLLLQYDCNK
jgi:hypothetical protein